MRFSRHILRFKHIEIDTSVNALLLLSSIDADPVLTERRRNFVERRRKNAHLQKLPESELAAMRTAHALRLSGRGRLFCEDLEVNEGELLGFGCR